MVALKRVKFSSNRKETFGFKTSEIPAPVPELKEFEGKLFDLVKSVEFRAISNTFQDELNNNIRNIQNETRLFLPADKTTNFYKVDAKIAEALVEKEITKDYKKSNKRTLNSINKEVKSIGIKL